MVDIQYIMIWNPNCKCQRDPQTPKLDQEPGVWPKADCLRLSCLGGANSRQLVAPSGGLTDLLTFYFASGILFNPKTGKTQIQGGINQSNIQRTVWNSDSVCQPFAMVDIALSAKKNLSLYMQKAESPQKHQSFHTPAKTLFGSHVHYSIVYLYTIV